MTKAHSPSPAQDTPKPSAAEIRALVNAELGRASGPWHVALLLGALTVTGINIALLLTEPGLPPRARSARAIAFAVMVAMGSCWSVAAALVLARRGILLGKDRVIAAQLAATFTTVFTLGVGAVGRWGPAGRPGYVFMAAGLAMMAVAAVVLLRARRRFDQLSSRRAELERALAGGQAGAAKKNRERKHRPADTAAGAELTRFYQVMGAVAIVGIAIVGFSVGSKVMSPTVSAPIVLAGLDDSKLMEMAAPRVKGDPDAPIVIMEFGDFQCPGCGGFFSDVEPLIEAEFLATGKAQFWFYDFPLVQVHPNAFLAARAARCADDQGKFWPFHDTLYRTQGRWSSLQNPADEFEDYADQLGIAADDFSSCLRSDRHADVVSASLDIGTKLQIPATPTVFVRPAKGGRGVMVASSIEGIREGVARYQGSDTVQLRERGCARGGRETAVC